MIEKIYLVAIAIFTLWVLYLYYVSELEHKMELDKIENLERKFRDKEKTLADIRAKTLACPISDLDTPRKCYFDSGYKCSWNIDGERCDKK